MYFENVESDVIVGRQTIENRRIEKQELFLYEKRDMEGPFAIYSEDARLLLVECEVNSEGIAELLKHYN